MSRWTNIKVKQNERRLKPAQCTQERGDDSSQSQRAIVSVFTQKTCDTMVNFLNLFLTHGHSRSLGLEPLCLTHHTFICFSHLVLQSQLHT